MNKQFQYRQFKVGSPLTHALVVIVGIIVIALSLALGFFVFIGFGGFILVMTAVFAVRNWWYRRRFAGRHDEGIRRETRAEKQIIEGEYQEVRERKRDQRGP